MESNNKIEQTISNSNLVAGYLKGELNEVEQTDLLNWINENDHNRNLFERLCNEANLISAYAQFDLFDDKAALAKVKSHPDFVSVEESHIKPTKRLWPRIAIAAAVATIIFGAGLFYFNQNSGKQQADQVALKNDIAPGKTGATLTLANGKKIKLSDVANGELANEAGVTITKSSDGSLIYEIKDSETEPNKINTLSTAKGETYQVRLPDGSLVWLNAASSLTYAANLHDRGVRRVKLDGEGYFEIAKDKTRPFIVESQGQEVEVLGTHFNINSYVDESNIKTTLVEGSVRIDNETVLKPDQQAINNKGEIKVIPVDANSYTDWISGEFYFDKEPIESVMRKIARWYDIEVVYQGTEKEARIFSGTVSRYDQLGKMLKLMHKSEGINFKVEGRRVTVLR